MAANTVITLTVQGAQGTYPVLIGPGMFHDNLPAYVVERGFKRCAVITNATVAPLYGDLAGRLPGGFLVTVPDGEQYKTLDTLRQMYDHLLDHHADRSTLVVALGGGVIGDMAGFAAATFMRGIALVQAPTTLLAMVDASIGGKVGVDLPQGKNLAGAFKDPLGVFADTTTLQTLPNVEFQCGMAEVIKSALISDSALLNHLETHGPAPIEHIIHRAAAVKVAIVGQDRLESGIRAYLNLGHTFAHAIEHVSGFAWKHGQAVAIGLVAAARLSERLSLCPAGLSAHVERMLAQANLPTRFRGLPSGDLWQAMHHDKKWRDGSMTFVLLRDIGQPHIVDGVNEADAVAVLDSLREDA